MQKKGRLSVVIPCYNSEKNIESVLAEMKQVFLDNRIDDYEIILVNDCSKDNTFSIIRKMAEENKNITAIDLAKNAGQHGALMAGFHYVTGEYVVTCEDDGQTEISAISEMMSKLSQGYDVVTAKYKQRPQTSIMRRMGRFMGKKMSSYMLPRPEGLSVSIFFLARRFVIDEMIRYDNPYPYVLGLLLRTTQNIANVEIEQRARMNGGSGYTFRKLLNLWLDGFTAFSVKPLRIASLLGGVFSVLGVLLAIFLIIRRLAFDIGMADWSLIASIMLVIGGVILCVLGMIGEYVGRIYICINNAPQYVIRHIVSQEWSAEQKLSEMTRREDK